MQEKSIHIVFQVLNFIFSEASSNYRLLPVDRLLLVALAKHHGSKGIYPSTRTLARELHLSKTHIKERINYLDSINLIKINRKNGCSHFYYLEFLSTDRSTTVDRLPEIDRSTTPAGTGQPQRPHRSTTVDRINTNNQNRLNKTERARINRALPLPDDFMINEKNKALCDEKNLDSNFLTKKFIAMCKSQGKTSVDHQAAFELFVLSERETKPKKQNAANCAEKKEVEDLYLPCAGCKRPPHACTCNLASRETSLKFIREIKSKFLVNH